MNKYDITAKSLFSYRGDSTRNWEI